MQARLLKFLAVAVILGAGCATALADMVGDLGLTIEAIGDDVPGSSYNRPITITTNQAFDLIAVKPADGSSVTLSGQYLSGFAPADAWTPLLVGTPDLAAAQGTPSTLSIGGIQLWREKLTVTLLPSSSPYGSAHWGDAFVVAVWAANQNPDPIYQCVTVRWLGWWTFDTGQWDISRAEITGVPAPAAVVLGMLGLGLVGWLKRRVA